MLTLKHATRTSTEQTSMRTTWSERQNCSPNLVFLEWVHQNQHQNSKCGSIQAQHDFPHLLCSGGMFLNSSIMQLFEDARSSLQWFFRSSLKLFSKKGNGRNTVSRVLFRKRELTEFCSKLGEFREKLGEFALAHK